MENKNWKYVKRNNSVISLIDLRVEFNRQTGIEIPLSHEYCGDINYIMWMEAELVKLKTLTHKLIPFET